MISTTPTKLKWLLPPKRQNMVPVLGTVFVVTGKEQNRRQLPLFGQVGYNPVSCLKKIAPTSERFKPLSVRGIFEPDAVCLRRGI
jgi:hypothetical protein